MVELRGMLALVTLMLTLSQSRNANASVKSSSQSYYYPQSHIQYSFYAIKEGILVYAVCDDKNVDITSEKNCTVIQRQYPYDQVTRACNVTIPVRHPHPDNANLTHSIAVHAFGQENAILLWSELNSHPTFNLMVIQLSSCNTKMLRLDDHQQAIYKQQIRSLRLVTYDNEFDIFIDVDQKEQTANEIDTPDGARISFDRDIRPIYDNIKSKGYDYIQFVSPIDTRSPDKGYVYKAGRKHSYICVLAKPNGTRKLLASDLDHPSMNSANDGYISSCVRVVNGTQLLCTQYDENGEIKFVFPHDSFKLTTVHTTPRGGFLLVTYEKSWHDFRLPTNYKFIRVGADGTRLGSIQSIDFTNKSLHREIYSVWENGDDEHCYTLVRQSSTRRDYLQIDVNCFSDDDLSK